MVRPTCVKRTLGGPTSDGWDQLSYLGYLHRLVKGRAWSPHLHEMQVQASDVGISFTEKHVVSDDACDGLSAAHDGVLAAQPHWGMRAAHVAQLK